MEEKKQGNQEIRSKENKVKTGFEVDAPIGPEDWEDLVDIPEDLAKELIDLARKYQSSSSDSEDNLANLTELFKKGRKHFSSRRLFFAYFGLIDPGGDAQGKEREEEYEIPLSVGYDDLDLEGVEPFDLGIFMVAKGAKKAQIETAVLSLQDTKYANVRSDYIDISPGLFRELHEKVPEIFKRVLVTLRKLQDEVPISIKRDGTFTGFYVKKTD